MALRLSGTKAYLWFKVTHKTWTVQYTQKCASVEFLYSVWLTIKPPGVPLLPPALQLFPAPSLPVRSNLSVLACSTFARAETGGYRSWPVDCVVNILCSPCLSPNVFWLVTPAEYLFNKRSALLLLFLQASPPVIPPSIFLFLHRL